MNIVERNSRNHEINKYKKEFIIDLREECIDKIKKLKGNGFSMVHRDSLEEILIKQRF